MATSIAGRSSYWRDRWSRSRPTKSTSRDIKILVLCALIMRALVQFSSKGPMGAWENIWLPLIGGAGGVLLYEAIRFVWVFVFSAPMDIHLSSVTDMRRLERRIAELEDALEARAKHQKTRETIGSLINQCNWYSKKAETGNTNVALPDIDGLLLQSWAFFNKELNDPVFNQKFFVATDSNGINSIPKTGMVDDSNREAVVKVLSAVRVTLEECIGHFPFDP